MNDIWWQEIFIWDYVAYIPNWNVHNFKIWKVLNITPKWITIDVWEKTRYKTRLRRTRRQFVKVDINKVLENDKRMRDEKWDWEN